MNDNKNFLSSDSELSSTSSVEAGLDRKADAEATMVEKRPERSANDASENFRSFTYVSSRGFFFQ